MTAQAIAVQVLSEVVGVPVSTRLPEMKPPQFIVVSRIGGGTSDFALRNPRFLVECYAHTELGAEELAELAHERWHGLRHRLIHRCVSDNNLARYDDPDPELFRFQFTGTMLLRAQ